MRGFEIAKGFEELEIQFPKRSTKRSAGYDFSIIEETVIPANGIIACKTGLKAYMNDDEVLFIYPRSSLAKKRGLMLSNNVGVVDADYYNNPDNDGHIMISLRNFTSNEVTLPRGERVAQGIFQKYLKATNEEEVINSREGGFGSTDK